MSASIPSHQAQESPGFSRGEDVKWAIEDSDSPTPREAAQSVWATVFSRTRAGTGDACVFTVTDTITGESVTVDLADDPAAGVDAEG